MQRTTLLYVACAVVLAACSGKPAATPTPDFATPASNRAEIHDDSDHVEHADRADANAAEHTDHTATENVPTESAPVAMEMGVALVPVELVVGQNRFAVGLFDQSGQPINDAEVQFVYYDLTDPQAPTLESNAVAAPVTTPDGAMTIFVQDRNFARAGQWGAEVQAKFPDGAAAVKRISFQVLPDSPSLRPGALTPAVDTPTAADVGNDLTRLTSAPVPNPAFYTVDLATALTNGKPTVLLLATPAFCQTRFCGPAYEITGELQKRFGDAANFIHVEIYTGLPNPAANNWELAPVMTAFGLTTEPWLYLIDANGTVAFRAESMFTADEIASHLQPLLDHS